MPFDEAIEDAIAAFNAGYLWWEDEKEWRLVQYGLPADEGAGDADAQCRLLVATLASQSHGCQFGDGSGVA